MRTCRQSGYARSYESQTLWFAPRQVIGEVLFSGDVRMTHMSRMSRMSCMLRVEHTRACQNLLSKVSECHVVTCGSYVTLSYPDPIKIQLPSSSTIGQFGPKNLNQV